MPKLVVPIGFIFASIAVIVLFIVPGWQHFLAVRADGRHLDEINAEIDTLTKKRDMLNEQIINITKEDFDRLEQMVPPASQSLEFLIFLEGLAQARGLNVVKLDLLGTLSTKPRVVEKKSKTSGSSAAINTTGATNVSNMPSIQPRVPQAGTGSFNVVTEQPKTQLSETISASMEVSGSYEAFKDFLRDIESSIRITDVESLDLTPPSGSSGEFNFKLSLKTYYQ